MLKIHSIVKTIMEDVNKEDSSILSIYTKITDTLFNLIKWAGIPFIIYLVAEAARL